MDAMAYEQTAAVTAGCRWVTIAVTSFPCDAHVCGEGCRVPDPEVGTEDDREGEAGEDVCGMPCQLRDCNHNHDCNRGGGGNVGG
jgi:hypothetical protein